MSKVVVTLIASPSEKMASSLVTKIAEALGREGAHLLATDWLEDRIACDLVLTRMEPEIAREVVAAALGAEPVDAITQDTNDRQKRMLISDMDSTIITIECIDEIADFAGMKAQVAAITERAMRGEIAFAGALTERVALLKGMQEKVLQQVYAERVRFMPGAKELVATMRTNGAYTMLVSGGFDFFTSRVRRDLGFNEDSSNRLEVKDGVLTGNVIPPILGSDAKLQALMEKSAGLGIGTDQVLAVGDGANDLPMMMAAGLGVAFHAKPLVQQSARARITHTDLKSLLYAQGYRSEEIVSTLPEEG